MTKFNRLALCVLAFSLPACTSTGSTPPESRVANKPQMAVQPLGSDEVLSRFSVLPAQSLAAGECGLFLWLKRDDAPLVFFQKSDGSAVMMIDGVESPMRRMSQKGRIALEYFESQSFETADLALDVTVTPEAKRSLQQGLKLPSGMVSIETADGWSAVLPVIGLIGCK
ncbi:hypothetical protein ACFO5Q_09235 [Kordiimonas lipolytica]|uniref:Lipoprotein n=1 Tax=Kordiimonas lipolytica TaxID=1662421 RepID=A0ABV8UBH5_9PROT|nr:hypothetical protein [Kordiimonas lipolytica]